ncbi:hypothetical protein [Oceaniradius stylonematis]|uniref:hypothetical protein n=1 Tax=Oceaniradius stylonematis TaxID=2184161 RepID=UPI0035D0E0D5
MVDPAGRMARPSGSADRYWVEFVIAMIMLVIAICIGVLAGLTALPDVTLDHVRTFALIATAVGGFALAIWRATIADRSRAIAEERRLNELRRWYLQRYKEALDLIIDELRLEQLPGGYPELVNAIYDTYFSTDLGFNGPPEEQQGE